jgi:hypothetical protein
MSSSQQEKSIPQQQGVMRPRCQLEGAEIVREFQDAGISGGGMKQRDDFLEMLRFCQQCEKAGQAIDAIACYDTGRFSRATSMETAHYIWEFQQAGVHRVLTSERWFDFRKKEDRAMFLLEQDFANHGFLVEHSRRVLRGKKTAAEAAYFTGGAVPYGFDRMLLDENDDEVERIPRKGKIKFKRQGWHLALIPIPAADPDPDRQLERQTAVWLYQTFAAGNVSFRFLARQLNDRGVPGPGGNPGRRRAYTGPARWTYDAVGYILTSPAYAGFSCQGAKCQGKYHRLIGGEIEPVAPGAKAVVNRSGLPQVPLQYGGLVDKGLWDLVQAKVAERRRNKVLARGGGYVLPSGVLRCGHCGGKMFGAPAGAGPGTYRRYVCPTNRKRPGGCHQYSVREERLVPALVKKVLDEYLTPERVAKLRAKLLARVGAKHERSPVQAENLRKRVADLDVEIRQAVRNVMQAKENVDLLNEGLSELRAQRDRLARDLEAEERARRVPVEDLEAEVERAVDRLNDLRQGLQTAGREKLGELLRRLVSRVDLYFEPYEGKNKTWFRFAKGVIKLRPALEVESSGALGVSFRGCWN